jgi:hypothetical protein
VFSFVECEAHVHYLGRHEAAALTTDERHVNSCPQVGSVAHPPVFGGSTDGIIGHPNRY